MFPQLKWIGFFLFRCRMGHVNNSLAVDPPPSNPPPVPAPIQTQVCSSPAGPSGQHLAVVTPAHDLTDSRSGWLDGIFGCFRPVFWNLASKANKGISDDIARQLLQSKRFLK